jgi:hypothetical protein
MNDALAGNGYKPAPGSHEERQVQLAAIWTGALDQLKRYLEARQDQPDRPAGGPEKEAVLRETKRQ